MPPDARRQLDFLLGRNPFGVSLVPAPARSIRCNPHHQVAKLLPAAWYASGNVIGSFAGGLAKKSQYPFRGDPDLKAAVLGDTASPFAPFEHGRFNVPRHLTRTTSATSRRSTRTATCWRRCWG